MHANDRIPRSQDAKRQRLGGGASCAPVLILALVLALVLAFALGGCSTARQSSNIEETTDQSQSQDQDQSQNQDQSSAESEDAESGESPSSGDSGAATSVVLNDNNLVDPTQRADNSFIYDTTIESLFEQASLYDGRTVQIVGEVVGDRINANDGTDRCWIMLTSLEADNASSISVLLSAEQANQIDHYGRYGVTGTTLQVRGTYYQACSNHDGIPDVHATASSVISKGIEHPDSLSPREFLPGLLAIIIGLALLGIFYFARERMR